MIVLSNVRDHPEVGVHGCRVGLQRECLAEERIADVLDHIGREQNTEDDIHRAFVLIERAIFACVAQERQHDKIHADVVAVAADQRGDLRGRADDERISEHCRDQGCDQPADTLADGLGGQEGEIHTDAQTDNDQAENIHE